MINKRSPPHRLEHESKTNLIERYSKLEKDFLNLALLYKREQENNQILLSRLEEI
jgi:hypothetical protein